MEEIRRKPGKSSAVWDSSTARPPIRRLSPKIRKRGGDLEQGGKFSEKEILDFYRQVVGEISGLIPQGSISIEVYADLSTTAESMLAQGREMFSWIPNAHIKFPSSREGLTAAEQAVQKGLRVNLTLCFSQEQAAAVYAATRGGKKGEVFVSPFIGRLDDRGENGMDLIAHILRMYEKGDGHVEVLTASVRTMDHLLYALKLGSDIITAPAAILKQWGEEGLPLPGVEYGYDSRGLKTMPYREIDLNKKWQEFDLSHELTIKGMDSFSKDWNSLLMNS